MLPPSKSLLYPKLKTSMWYHITFSDLSRYKKIRLAHPIVVLQENDIQQLSRDLVLWASAYEYVRKHKITSLSRKEKITYVNIEAKEDTTGIFDANITTSKKPNFTSGIYFKATKVAQCRTVAENRRFKKEVEKETAKKKVTCKFCLQQNKSEYFQKCQYRMDNIFSSSEETMLITLIYLSSNTFKGAYFHLRSNLGNLPNKRSPELAAEIIWRLNVWSLVKSSDILGGIHQHHLPSLLFIINM